MRLSDLDLCGPLLSALSLPCSSAVDDPDSLFRCLILNISYAYSVVPLTVCKYSGTDSGRGLFVQ